MKPSFITLALLLAGALSAWAGDLIPMERTAIFPEAKAKQLVKEVSYKAPEKIDGYWTPAEADLKGVEEGLAAFLKTKEADAKWNWAGYRRQVAGLKRGQEKFIFIYYFHFDTGSEKHLPKEQRDQWKGVP